MTVTPSALVLRDALVGSHFGILEQMDRTNLDPDDVPISVYAGRLGNTEVFTGSAAPRPCSGAGFDDTGAMLACLGEGVERYCAALERPGAVQFARAAELPGRVATPNAFTLFSPRQYARRTARFPFHRWSEEMPIGWVAAESLIHHDRAWVPAVMVQQPYRQREGEVLFTPGLSTGLACGATRESAIRRALLEVVERDAVALSWLTQAVPPRLNPTTINDPDPETASLLSFLARRGYELSLLDLSGSLDVPVVGALLRGHSAYGLITSFGSACDLTFSAALKRALLECGHSRAYVKYLRRSRPTWKSSRRFADVESFADHALFYSAHPEHKKALDAWRKPLPETPPRCNNLANMEELLQLSAKQCPDVLAVELTTPDIAELNLFVYRVLVPGLQPLHGNHNWPHLGGSRLQNYAPGGTPQRRLKPNPFPHPCA